MMGETETQGGKANKKKPKISDKGEKKIEKKIPTEEEDLDKNPDIEDPRLYSPLQEPDRPAPCERVADEDAGMEATESDDL